MITDSAWVHSELTPVVKELLREAARQLTGHKRRAFLAQVVYYPPDHSKYNPIERCWAVLEKHWNGALLKEVPTALRWAKTMTWKGVAPLVKLTRKIYRKGRRLVGAAKRELEARLQRHPDLPWWDLRIHPRPV
jgi:transposase